MRALVVPTAAMFFAASGCKPKVIYADDVDVGAIKAAFKCNGPTSGERADACRMTDDYATAGAFASAPAKGLETWFGRKVCTDTVDSNVMTFGQVHLKPGVGTPLWGPDDVKTDPRRDLPYGAQFIGTSVGNINPPSLRAEYTKALVAAEKGNAPDYSALPSFDRDRMDRFWVSVQKPPGTTVYYRLVQSDGTSILGGPSWSSDKKGAASASYFVRGKDRRMLVMYPGKESCVAELWKVYVEP